MRKRGTNKSQSRIQKAKIVDNNANFQCTYCHKIFELEAPFLAHKCELMEREEEIKTPVGQAAWSYYQKWLKLYKKTVDIRGFIMSKRYYRTFLKFADFAQRVRLTDPDIFILMMKEKNIPPALWTNDQIYVLYLEHLDHVTSPVELGEKTATFMHQIAEVLECKVENVFEELQPGDILEFIRERKFTPWLLLRSRRFGQYLKSLDPDDRNQFTSLINSKYWSYKFDTNPEIVKWMDTKAQELNI